MREPDYQFFRLDSEEETQRLIAMWEKVMGTPVAPASPQRLFIAWLVTYIINLKAETNHRINKNLASRAEGEDLDVLGEDIYNTQRPQAEPAVCTVRFHISEPQAQAVVVPAGTRVTDKGGALMWALPFDLYIEAGAAYADAKVQCQTPGTAGNGYAKGQINTLVDLYDYCAGVENVTATEGGADTMDDDSYFELMKLGMDAMSTGGAEGSYIYNAKKANSLIGDVVANTSGPAQVKIYVLMQDGTAAGDEIKAAVVEACSRETRRPMTDLVSAADPEPVEYNIALTYYIKQDATAKFEEIERAVKTAVTEYAAWQGKKMGRDINPDKLREYLSRVGKTYDEETGQYVGEGAIKRIVLTSPSYTVLRNGREPPDPKTPLQYPAPQVARLGTMTLTNGGVEDE